MKQTLILGFFVGAALTMMVGWMLDGTGLPAPVLLLLAWLLGAGACFVVCGGSPSEGDTAEEQAQSARDTTETWRGGILGATVGLIVLAWGLL